MHEGACKYLERLTVLFFFMHMYICMPHRWTHPGQLAIIMKLVASPPQPGSLTLLALCLEAHSGFLRWPLVSFIITLSLLLPLLPCSKLYWLPARPLHAHLYIYIYLYIHCKNKMVRVTTYDPHRFVFTVYVVTFTISFYSDTVLLLK